MEQKRFLRNVNQGQIRVYNGNTRIEAEGKNAETITNAVAVMFLLFGVAAVIEAAKRKS